MRISEKWLREWVDPGVDGDRIAHQLTMAGLEVEEVIPVKAGLSGVIAGEVKAVKSHPDADNLQVCTVSAGGGDDLTVVCGADNVRPGIRVPFAPAGTELPDGTVISESSIRGVASQGMLCSAAELGFSEEADGLLVLPDNVVAGQPLADEIGGPDTLLEVALTPNRGDCLSIYGIAREVAVLNQCPLREPQIEEIAAAHDDQRDVHLEAGNDCPHYVGRKITGVGVNRPSPLWLQKKLLTAGIRSINPVVDITNFVMLELGQPMHAFDDDRLVGDIRVRFAASGEKLQLLDEQTCEFDQEVLVIADDTRALAMAGIMGGLESAVTDHTVNLFLESAWFEPKTVSGLARRYGLHTDSSHRFERGVDYTLQQPAMERATQLILEICGGEAGPVINREIATGLPQRSAICLQSHSVERVLGIQVPAETIRSTLEALDMEVESGEGGWQVTPPPRRFDISLEVDLVEEIARIAGYDSIPDEAPRADLQMYPPNLQQGVLERVRSALVHQGYQEAITYSFVAADLQELLNPAIEGLPLANPISSDLAVMRTSLWPGLLTAVQHNVNRQQSRVRLFESGLVFGKNPDSLTQDPVVGGVIYGNVYEEQWDIKESGSDFYDLKHDVDEILAAAGIPGEAVSYRIAVHTALHPGQSAEITYENQVIGRLGCLHPSIQSKLDLARPAYMFELDLRRISIQLTPKYCKISKFPMIRRDIAIVVDEGIPVADVVDCIHKNTGNYLVNLELFDVYQGEGIDLGKKSLAIGLTFQGSSSTLTDKEVEAIMGDVLTHLRADLGGTLRE